MPRSVLAAAILVVGGTLVVLGSFSVWGACSSEPCDPEVLGLLYVYERSGVDLGWGIVTAVLGAAVLVLAVGALLGRGRRPLLERLAAVGILLAVGLHLYLSTYGPSAADDGFIATPYIAVYVTVVGAMVVLAASLARLADRRPDPD